MSSQNKIFNIQNHLVDLSRIKTIKLRVQYSGDKDNKRVTIIHKDRIEYIFSPLTQQIEREILNDEIELDFKTQDEATIAYELLQEKWEAFLSN